MDPLEWQWRYLAPDGNTFWDWNVDGDAVVWWNGETISLYEELSLVIERLQPGGLPRFEELLLVLAATRRGWPEAEGSATLFTGKIEQLDPQGWKDFPIFKWLKPLYDGLNRVHRLARREGFGSAVSLAVLEAVFGSKRGAMAPGDADDLLLAFRSGEIGLLLQSKARRLKSNNSRIPPLSLLQTVRNLVETLKDLNENIELRVVEQTGLHSIVNPAELDDLPHVEKVRCVVHGLLKEEGELGGLGLIARQLGAVASFPRRLSDPTDQPIGGYSDLANRGEIDRLLISELAQDPEVLAMRVALNEALYLRRESPPNEPARRRMIFVDTGIRMWGIPRVYACGAALAFAMRQDATQEVIVYTPRGDQVIAADIASRDGVIGLMSRLTPEPDPGRSMARLLAELAGEDVELIMITTGRVWADPEFRTTIREHRPDSFFVALVEGDGSFRSLVVSAAGERELQRAQLDVDALLGEKPDMIVPKTFIASDDRLPRFFAMKDCPLRFATGFSVKRAVFHHEAGLLVHTSQGQLLLWKNPDLGAQLVTSEMPKGHPIWSEIQSEIRRASFLFARGDGTVLLFEVGLDSGENETTRITLPFPKVDAVYRVADVIVLFGGAEAFAFGIGLGRCLGRARLPGKCVRIMDHFVQCGTEWFAMQLMSFNDEEKVRPVKSIPLNERGSSVLGFEGLPCTGAEMVWMHAHWPAPLAIDSDLRVTCLNDPPSEVIDRSAVPGEFHGVSSDRLRVFVQREDGQGYAHDVLRNQVTNLFGPFNPIDNERAVADIRAKIPNLRHNVKEVFLSPVAGFHLRTKGDDLLSLAIEGGRRKRIIWRSERFYKTARGRGWIRAVNRGRGEADWDDRVKAAEFERVDTSHRGRFALELIEFPEGSRLWLDRRGLLHMQSAERGVPEVAIVLKDGETAGWCSDGKWFGQRYFIGGRTSEPEFAFRYVEKFVTGILRHNDRTGLQLESLQPKGGRKRD